MNRPEEKDKGLVLKEYGRNTQRLVDYLMTIEDREKRTALAKTLIDLMKQLNPATKESTDHTQRLWDHLYIMSNFQLDVDSEYPLPEKSILGKKPSKVPYNNNQLKFKHYGKNIELLIAKAMEIESPEETENAVIYLGRLMKRFYTTWNKENVEDEVILQQLNILSKGRLTLPIEKIKNENLFNITLGEPSKDLNKFNSLFVNYPDKELNRSNGGNNNGARRSNGKPNNFKKRTR
ncbi:MAG: DUF4290 domain-containing protein [Cytophagales bacterium]|nr:MAG: DUF4290 domain-containing protein [Cytophagales bacterium]